MRNFLVQSLISRSLQLPKNTRPKLSVNFKANKKPERTPKNRLVPCDPAGSRKLSPLGEEHPPKVPRIASIVACTNRHLPHLTKQTQIKTIKVNESQCSQKVNNLSFPYTSPSKENTTQQQLKQNGANPTSLKTALNIKKKKKTQPHGFICSSFKVSKEARAIDLPLRKTERQKLKAGGRVITDQISTPRQVRREKAELRQ